MSDGKKKILFIVTQAKWGGAQKYVFDLAQNLAEKFDITVAAGTTRNSQELFDKLQALNIKTKTLRHLKRAISPWHDFLAILELKNFLQQNHFDIVHLNSSKAGVIGSLAGHFSKKTKIIYTAHGWVYLEPLPFYKRRLYLLMEKIACRWRDYTIVLSEKEKEIGKQNKTACQNTTIVIPNGIDLEKITFLDKKDAEEKLSSFTASIKLESNNLIIGTIANFYKTKSLDLLLSTFEKNRQKNPACRLIIFGDGPERKNIETIIKKLNLERDVILAGALPNAHQYLKAFDVFVLPSIKEGFPYSILEAMAAGLPIIATKVGAIPEILTNEKDCLLIDPNNQSQLIQALEQLINNETLRDSLGKNALEKVKQYNLKNQIEKTASLY